MSLHVTSLAIDPTSGGKCGNILGGKMVFFAVNDMFFHELVQLMKIVERNGRVTMMFRYGSKKNRNGMTM